MNMKNVSSKTLLPFALLSSALLLSACDQMNTPQTQTTNQDDSSASSNSNTNPTNAPLSSGNMFYIVRDVADLQLKAGQYVEQLNQTKSELQTAVDAQDPQQLQIAATQLQQQLQGFNQTLSSLDLKTQEIDTIRQNLLTANQQVLASPFCGQHFIPLLQTPTRSILFRSSVCVILDRIEFGLNAVEKRSEA